MNKLLTLVGVVIAAFGAWYLIHKSHDTSTSTTTTTGTTTTTTPGTQPVKAYFYRGGGLVPVAVRVPKTDAVATAALHALLDGPPGGASTAIPAGTKLLNLTIGANGFATADFSPGLAGAPRTAQAQIVYTLTQFPSVKGVLIDEAGQPIALTDGAGATVYTPVWRDTYVDLTPDAPIFVATPKRDSTVSSPVTVSGTALVFEATFALEVRSGSTVLEHDTITASAGAPDRGSFSKTLDLAPGDYQLVLFEPSAQDGSPLHTTTVDITVTG
jgi:hypothetical protein